MGTKKKEVWLSRPPKLDRIYHFPVKAKMRKTSWRYHPVICLHNKSKSVTATAAHTLHTTTHSRHNWIRCSHDGFLLSLKFINDYKIYYTDNIDKYKKLLVDMDEKSIDRMGRYDQYKKTLFAKKQISKNYYTVYVKIEVRNRDS